MRRTSNVWIKLAAGCAASYILIGVSLFLIPRTTSVHHWILGTPFQYAAMALAVTGLSGLAAERTRMTRLCQTILLVAVMALIAVRIPNVFAVEQSFMQGGASQQFHPDFTRVAELAAARAPDAVFVSADWGTANQIYCVANGTPDLVHEPYWGADPGARVQDIATTTTKPTMYVVVAALAPQFEKASETIIRAMVEDPRWQESPVEKEFSELQRIRVRKFVRRR